MSEPLAVPSAPKRVDPDFKAKWVAALRSGKYKQAEGRLIRINSVNGERRYCCLGVACLVAGLEPRIGLTEPSFQGETSTLPAQMAHQYGLDSSPEIPAIFLTSEERREMAWYLGTPVPLWRLNDTLRLSFERIAELIEAAL